MPVAISPEIVIVEAAGVEEPRVAAKADRFVVVWERLAAADKADLLGATYGRSGARLSGPTAIDSVAGPEQAFDVSISVDRGGTFVAGYWSSQIFPESGARYRSLGTAGSPAGASAGLSPDFDAFYGQVINSGAETVVTGLGNGRFLAVWSDTNGPGSTTQALRMRIVGSAPVAEKNVDIDAGNTNLLGDYTVATGLANGGFAVAWKRFIKPGVAAPVLQLHSATGAKVGPRITLSPVYAFSGDNTFFGDLAPTPDNGVLYAWRERAVNVLGANPTIDTFVQRYSATGKAVGKPIQVNDTLESQTPAEDNVAIATFADGRSVVVWTETKVRDSLARSRDVVMAQLLSKTGTPIGVNLEVDTQAAFGSLTRVDVATLGTDRFVVTWRADTGTGTARVLARLFDTKDKGVTRSGDGKPNTLSGSPRNDVLLGKAGADKLLAGAGDDILDGGAGPDSLDGGPGSDTARFARAVTVNLGTSKGGKGEAVGDRYKSVENAIGSPGNDRIAGTADFNILNGNGGNDVIDGGPRADRVIGGKGRDVFVSDSDTDIPDILPDFVSGQDRLSFENNGFTTFPLALSPGFSQGPALPNNTGATKDSFFFHTGLRRLYYDMGSWIEFARMPNTPSLRRSDIEVK